jgi:[amino group carrier protein]-L-2-aminoadipate 6-kinase
MLILKIGGGRGINIGGIANDLRELSGPVVVVHGANAWRDELAAKLGTPVEVVTSVRGYDSVLATESSMDVMLMAYAGLRNKRIVEAFQRRGIPAIGLTGIDGRAIIGKRNMGIQSRQGDKIILRRDLSGKPQGTNMPLLKLLTDNGYVPVLTVPICDQDGVAISADNDDIAAVLHRDLHATTVVSLLEAPGFLRAPDDPSTVIAQMTRADVKQWEERSSGRIKRKLHAICRLLDEYPTRVILADGRSGHPLRDALDGRGTVIE